MKAYSVTGTRSNPIFKSWEAAREYQEVYGGYIHEFEMEEDEE